ncbi:MAG: IS256 family transposase [Caldilineaceae bacterium]|nr:IS256 family transposase [Caldilineaceae bacterium]
MTPHNHDTASPDLTQETFQELLQEKLRAAVRLTLATVLEEEVEAYLQAGRYERTPQRRDRRNGYYSRGLGTGVGQIDELPVPRTRKGHRTQLFKRYQRRQQELDAAICEMFVSGASMEQVGQVMESLTGQAPSPATVSRTFHSLESEYKVWKERQLSAHYHYAFADGTYFTVIYGDKGHKMPILAVVGINLQGEKEVLGFTTGDRENQHAWNDLLDDLKERGLQQVDLWISDGHQATMNAITSRFPNAQRQRCVLHKINNVLGYIPKQQQTVVKPELKAIFYHDSLEKAQQELAAFCVKYESLYPSAVACLQRDIDACLTFYCFPETHWRTIRTNNPIERLFAEVKKRSHKMAAAFRNEDSCLLLFYAVTRTLQFKRVSMPRNRT